MRTDFNTSCACPRSWPKRATIAPSSCPRSWVSTSNAIARPIQRSYRTCATRVGRADGCRECDSSGHRVTCLVTKRSAGERGWALWTSATRRACSTRELDALVVGLGSDGICWSRVSEIPSMPDTPIAAFRNLVWLDAGISGFGVRASSFSFRGSCGERALAAHGRPLDEEPSRAGATKGIDSFCGTTERTARASAGLGAWEEHHAPNGRDRVGLPRPVACAALAARTLQLVRVPRVGVPPPSDKKGHACLHSTTVFSERCATTPSVRPWQKSPAP